MAKIEFNGARASANSRVLTRIAVCSALGLSLSWLPSMALAQAAGGQPGSQQPESLPVIDAGAAPTSERNERLGSQTLAPLMVEGEAINSADAPTVGYSADATRAATKTDTPLITTPQAIDVVPREQVEDQGARTVNNALRYTPGVFTGLAGSSSRQTTIALRGFPGGDVNNTFMDGLRLANDPGSYSNIQIDPFFIERIDVIKGALSALYGRAQPGGLVNYVTKKPLDEQRRMVSVYGGSFGTYGAGLDLTGPLPNPEIGNYRVTVSGETSDTQYDVVERERFTIMPQVSFNLADDTSLLLQAYVQRDPEGGFHGSVPYDISVNGDRFGRTVDDEWVDSARNYEEFDRDINMLAFQLDHEVNDNVTLTSKGRYADVDTSLKQVYQNGFTPDATDAPATLTRYFSRAEENLKSLSFDNYGEVEFDTGDIEHRMVIGFGYEQRQNSVEYPPNTSFQATPLDAFNPNYGGPGIVDDDSLAPANDRKTRQVGFYLQDQMEWNRFHLVLGGRQDYLKREYVNGTSGELTDRSDNAFTGRAALLYQSKWGLSPYVSYSEGFNPSAYTPFNGDVAKPVDSHQYEAGLKYQPPGVDAMFTLAVYDLTQENVQQRFQVSPARFDSVGDVESQGIELSARADVTDRLNVLASYSHSSVEYADNFPGLGVIKGNTFTRTPDDLASAWAKYELTPAIDVGAGVRYVGESYADTANELTVPDYTLADAMVSVKLGEFAPSLDGATLRLNANNVFDKEYVEACFSPNNCYYGYAREVIATLDYQF
ncbi:TonB-dependent siderophore receptor [Salinisphaera sp.]|uniref:TonB-dependent siderophore receptor n=1 Tax=Salinisphaera sp. TaxID=1914330 RepID=UPI000C59A878|nr:TonB-dependent siderophore receptor [Salinisphaera sp.]MBS63740.1 TonB-dependent siderophore receptor [Salinisphaera sp.]